MDETGLSGGEGMWMWLGSGEEEESGHKVEEEE